MMISEALTQYIGTLTDVTQEQVPLSLHRFVRWCGRHREVQGIAPHEIETYTREMGGSSSAIISSQVKHLKDFLTYLKRVDLIKITLASHAKLRKDTGTNKERIRTRAKASTLTRDGYKALQEEMEALKGERYQIAADIRNAAADKDFKENAPLDAAREYQGRVESRIRDLEQQLSGAVVMERDGSATATVVVGSEVVLHDLATGRESVYTLVDPAEAEPVEGKLSVDSPVGRGLLGHLVGEEVQIVVPKGTIRYRIQSAQK